MPTSQWLRVPEPRLLCLVPSCGCQSQGDRISAVPSDPVPTSLRVSSCLPDEWKRGRGQLLSLEEAAEGQPRDHPLLMSSWSLHRDPRGMPCSWPCRSGRCLCAPGRDVVKSQGRTLGGGGGVSLIVWVGEGLPQQSVMRGVRLALLPGDVLPSSHGKPRGRRLNRSCHRGRCMSVVTGAGAV